MTIVLESLALAAAGCAVYYKLVKYMRDNLEPSAEMKKEVEKAEKLIKQFTYKKFEDKCFCEAFKGIAEDDFKAFVDELQKRLKLKDETKESILDILRGTGMDAERKHESNFEFSDGKGRLYHQEIIAEKSNGKINLAIAFYGLSFELDSIARISWNLFGFIPIIEKETSSEMKPITMTEGEQDTFSKWCQTKLFKYVDQKCNTSQIEA